MIGTSNLEKMMDLIGLYRFSRQRRAYVYRVLLDHLQNKPGFGATRRIIEEALEHDSQTHDLANRLSIEEPDHSRRHDEKAAAIDRALNRTLSSLATRLRSERDAFPEDHPIAQRARHVHRELFPDGPAAITRLPYVEKASEVEHLLQRLKTLFLDDIKAFALQHFLDRLQQLYDDYHPKLGPKQRPALTRALIAERDREGDAKLRYLVVHLLHEFGRPKVHDDQLCEQLLGPILAQNEDLGEYLKQRRAGKKVQAKLEQPKTEEKTETETEAEPAPAPQTQNPRPEAPATPTPSEFLPEPRRPLPANNPWARPRDPRLNRQLPPRPQAPRLRPQSLQNPRSAIFGHPHDRRPPRTHPMPPYPQAPGPNGFHPNDFQANGFGPYPERL